MESEVALSWESALSTAVYGEKIMTKLHKVARILLGGASTTAMALGFGAMAHAQEVADEGRSDLRPGSGEIVVTAQKREQGVQDVSISISALDEAALERAGIIDPTRLGLTVPGMVVGYSGNEARVAMRGARTNNVGAQAEQVVGFFEDGMYVASTTAALGHYLDVARIEVLRGPQGTLYGRNTFAGTINVITNEPDFGEISGSLSAQTGNYKQARFEGVLNVPISDTFALRFAGLADSHTGYIKNTYIDGSSDDLRNQNLQFGRVTAKWTPSDRFEAIARFGYMTKDTNADAIWGYTQIGCYRNNLNPATSTGWSANATYFKGHCFQPADATEQDDGAFSVSRNTPSRAKAESWTANLQLKYDLGFADLKFIGALNDFEHVQYYDVDYSNGRDPGTTDTSNFFGGYNGDQRNWSTELQLASNDKSRLEWMVGFYYFDQKDDWNFGYLNNGVYTPYYINSDIFQSKTVAVFGQATYSLTDKLRVTGGLRYNEDTKSSRFTAASDKWKKTLYRAGLEYDVSDDFLLYGTVSTGYRTGGVNGSALVAAGAPPIYEPENVRAYEVGFKSRTADGQFTLNGAFYYNDYTNMHAQSFVTTCIDRNNPNTCVASEYTENGGAIEAYGVEIDFKWLPGKSFFLNGTLAYNHSTFGEYNVGRVPGLGNLGGRQDVTRTLGQLIIAGAPLGLSYKGWTPALAPRWSGSLQAGYVIDLGGNHTLTPMVQMAASSKYWSFDINVPGSEQKAHTRTDLRLTWADKNRGLEVQAFVQNLENREVLTRSVIFDPGGQPAPTASIQANYADPRIWGLRVSLDF